MLTETTTAVERTERRLLAAAGVNVEDSVPIEVYQSMFPDVLTTPTKIRERLTTGILGTDEQIILLLHLLFQFSDPAHHTGVVFDSEKVEPLQTFRSHVSFMTSDDFTDSESAGFYSSQFNGIVESMVFYDSNALHMQMGLAAARVLLYQPYLFPETEADAAAEAALPAVQYVIDTLLAQSVKAA